MSHIVADVFGSKRPEPPKLTPFDYVTRLIVPVVALVAVIVAQLHDQRGVMWALIAVALLSFIASFYSLLAAWLKRRLDGWRDRRIARREFSKLREFVKRFEGFVASNRGDALHEAIMNEFGRNSETVSKFGIPPAQLFWGFWSSLNLRVERQRPTVENFEAVTSEFGMLVSQYNNYCFQAVFGQFPRDFKDRLNDKSRSGLNACRESFNEFLGAYEGFLQRLDTAFLERHIDIRTFPRAKPL